MTNTNSILRPIVAMLCIFAAINALAATNRTTREDRSSIHASRAVSQSIAIANGKYTSTRPTGAQLHRLADSVDRYLVESERDGSFAVHERSILKNLERVRHRSDAESILAHRGLQANGWNGDREEVDSALANLTDERRAAVIRLIKRAGLKTVMQNASRVLRSLGDDDAAAIARPSHFVNASFHGGARLLEVKRCPDCNAWNGIFLGLIAIGGVASLGGVNPLGDLLLAIGGVGAFAVWGYQSYEEY